MKQYKSMENIKFMFYTLKYKDIMTVLTLFMCGGKLAHRFVSHFLMRHLAENKTLITEYAC